MVSLYLALFLSSISVLFAQDSYQQGVYSVLEPSTFLEKIIQSCQYFKKNYEHMTVEERRRYGLDVVSFFVTGGEYVFDPQSKTLQRRDGPLFGMRDSGPTQSEWDEILKIMDWVAISVPIQDMKDLYDASLGSPENLREHHRAIFLLYAVVMARYADFMVTPQTFLKRVFDMDADESEMNQIVNRFDTVLFNSHDFNDAVIENNPHLLTYMDWAYDTLADLTDGVGNINFQSRMRTRNKNAPYKGVCAEKRMLKNELQRLPQFNDADPRYKWVEEMKRWNIDVRRDSEKLIPLKYRHVQLEKEANPKTFDEIFRELYKGVSYSNVDRSNPDALLHRFKNLIDWRMGNCDEYATQVYYMLLTYPKVLPNIRVDVIDMPHVDHMFILVGRTFGTGRDNKLPPIEQWNKDAYIIDPWLHYIGPIPDQSSPMYGIFHNQTMTCEASQYVGYFHTSYSDMMSMLQAKKEPLRDIPFAYTEEKDLDLYVQNTLAKLETDTLSNFSDFLYNYLLSDRCSSDMRARFIKGLLKTTNELLGSSFLKYLNKSIFLGGGMSLMPLEKYPGEAKGEFIIKLLEKDSSWLRAEPLKDILMYVYESYKNKLQNLLSYFLYYRPDVDTYLKDHNVQLRPNIDLYNENLNNLKTFLKNEAML